MLWKLKLSTIKRFEPCVHMIKNVYELKNKVLNVVEFNKAVLQKCQGCQYNDELRRHLICYSPGKLGRCGNDDAIQLKCNYGVLIETKVNDEVWCIKRPLYSSSFHAINVVQKRLSGVKGVVEYKDDLPLKDLCIHSQFYYPKIKYDPLRAEELEQCLCQFIQAVFEVIESIHSHRIRHKDVWIPNICFNQDYCPVLIDFLTFQKK